MTTWPRSHACARTRTRGRSRERRPMPDLSEAAGEPRPETDEDIEWMQDPGNVTWMAEHAAGLRRSVFGHRYLYWSLAIAFVLGLVLQIVGYVVRSASPQEPIGLITDLGYALGWAMWTGVVVVVFVQLVPEAKERQILRALEAYDAFMQEKAKVAGGRQAASGRTGPGTVETSESRPDPRSR